jgi:hypothetical protein
LKTDVIIDLLQSPLSQDKQMDQSLLKKALHNSLPPQYHDQIELITKVIAPFVDENAANNQPVSIPVTPGIQGALKELEGEQIKAGDTLVSFGEGTQSGEIYINGITNGNPIHIYLQASQTPEKTELTFTKQKPKQEEKKIDNRRLNILTYSMLVLGLLIGVLASVLFMYIFRPALGSATYPEIGTPIESIAEQIISFDGNARGELGQGRLAVIWNQGTDTDYRLEYSIPSESDPDKQAFAGLYFSFSPTEDITRFKTISTTLSFSSNVSQCSIYLQDQSGIQSYVRLSNEGVKGTGNGVTFMPVQGTQRYTFIIPVEGNFIDVPLNKGSIAGIGFGVNKDFVSGEHSCTIHEVILLEP